MSSRKATSPTDVLIQGSAGNSATTVQMYRCRMEWEDLKETGHAEVRFCDECSRSVFRARDLDGFLQLAASDRCAYVDQGERTLGMPASRFEPGKPLT